MSGINLVYFGIDLAPPRPVGGRISWYQLSGSEQANDLHLPLPLFMPESDLPPPPHNGIVKMFRHPSLPIDF